LPADGRLLARPRAKQTLLRYLRAYLHEVSAAAGITQRIVPHQLRHYAASRTMPRGSKRRDLRPSECEAACTPVVQHAA
jgi:site-specific recombinase XerD